MNDIARTRVTILPTGGFHGDSDWLLLDPMRMASGAEPHRQRDWISIPTYAVLIEHADGKRLLWDSGIPEEWESRWPSGQRRLFPVDDAANDLWLTIQLSRLGLEPADIDYLLLSHLHLDHAGNARLWEDTSTKIIVSEKEKEGAFSFDGYWSNGYIKPDYAGLELSVVRDDTEVLPGVTLLQTPGHTWGTMSLQVDLADTGTMLFTSDAVNLQENFGPPATKGAIVYDSIAWLASVEKIRAIATRTEALVVFGHSAEQLRTLRTGVGNYYT